MQIAGSTSRLRRGGSLAVGTALATLLALVSPAPAAHAAGAIPVVEVVLANQTVTFKTPPHLHAGWVTFRMSAGDQYGAFVTLSLHLPGAPERDDDPGSTDVPKTAAQQAAQNRSGVQKNERHYVPLGGAAVDPGKPIDLTVKLPAGAVDIGDTHAEQATRIDVAAGSDNTRPPRGDTVVSEGRDNVIHAPGTLPRSGTLQIEDTDTARYGWHRITLGRLGPGTDKAAIERLYSTKPGLPDKAARGSFTAYPVTGNACGLAAGQSIRITYSGLTPGRYALVDTAVDDRTGHVHAGDGSITFITVK